MSAAPKPEPAADPGDEGWALLDSLRRKLDDQSAQTRKATAQVGQLAESIAALVELQRKRSRWLNLNSFAAYLVFTFLLGGAFYFVYQSRANELVRRADDAVRRADDAVRRADDASARAVARDAADAKALEAWQLLEAGKRAEAQKKLDELAQAPLPRLEREVLAARAKQPDAAAPPHADNAVDKASAAFNAGRLAEVTATAETALAADPHGKQAPELHYFAGLAYARLGQTDRAVPSFEAAVAGGVPEDDAPFQLASALDRAGQWARAKTEYEKFASAHPQSPFAAFAQRRIATLSHPAPPQPAAQPAAPASEPAPKAAEPSASDPPAPAP